MNKHEAAELLNVSVRTLDNLMAAGKVTFTKNGDSKFAPVSFTHADLGLQPEPAPSAVCAEVALPYQDEPVRPAEVTATPRFPIHKIDIIKRDADEDFATAYREGRASDSAGNKIDGTNDRHPVRGMESLLGPQNPMPRVRPDPTSHMTPGTVGEAGNDRVENPVDSDAFADLLNPGHTERMKDLYRQCGVRPLSAQQQKERSDKLAIHAAFRWSR
jgi:hypothetical protein